MWKTMIFDFGVNTPGTYKTHSFQEFEIEYLLLGNGTHPVLAFHGFGREASDFDVFLEMLRPNEYLVAVNLFQHGNSNWPSDLDKQGNWNRKDHVALVESLLESLDAKSFSLLAYSMGGRIAMCTLLDMSERIEKTLLIAPDGFKINTLYSFSAKTKLGRWVYRGVIRNPRPILKLADGLRSMRFIDSKLHRFVHYHLRDEETRQKVFDSWLIFRDFQPNLNALSSLVNTGKEFQMVFGSYDRVIKVEWTKTFRKRLKADVVHLMPSGHQLMKEETVRFILERGLW